LIHAPADVKTTVNCYPAFKTRASCAVPSHREGVVSHAFQSVRTWTQHPSSWLSPPPLLLCCPPLSAFKFHTPPPVALDQTSSSSSDGCANAVKRILGKIDGVSNVDTNVEAKTVVVTADDSISPEFMLEKLQKWGNAAGKSVALAQ